MAVIMLPTDGRAKSASGMDEANPAKNSTNQANANNQTNKMDKTNKTSGKPAIESEAGRILKSMSDYMGRQRAFAFTSNSSIQIVTKEGQKLNLDSESKVSLERPNKLRSDRKGELADLTLFYDGKDVTLFDKNSKYFATAKAPATIDGAIDFTRDRLGIEAPAADLLVNRPYEALTEDVVAGMYIGRARINGVETHHLAFRGNEVDWQIWIADGPQPVPVKYLIVSKKEPQAPEFVVEMRDWNTSPKFPARFFTWIPPEDAKRIAFAGDQIRKVPETRGPASEDHPEKRQPDNSQQESHQ